LAEGSSRSALRKIRQNITPSCSGFLKIWFDAKRNQQYFVSKKTEWLEQEINLHIKVITKTYGAVAKEMYLFSVSSYTAQLFF
jgi:hypothetical protein